MIYVGLHTFLPPAHIYYTPPALRQEWAQYIVANPPFCADVLGVPAAPGKTLPAVVIIERLKQVQP